MPASFTPHHALCAQAVRTKSGPALLIGSEVIEITSSDAEGHAAALAVLLTRLGTADYNETRQRDDLKIVAAE